MGEEENSEESAVFESYKDFISIKEEPNTGTLVAVISLIFLFVIPFFSIEDAFYGDGSLCCGSIIVGLFLLIVGTAQSTTKYNRYQKATKHLAKTAGIPKKIAYPFFSLQAADKRILALVIQKYPFLTDSKPNLRSTKPSMIVISLDEEE
ncbi:MAG: hypothetical protein DWC09_03745 [Candidatus Poseidoniales archaeon]|nr:MAG: hypothetical protein DWC09_03745 [Candidatus Poseidoniales archaeon]